MEALFYTEIVQDRHSQDLLSISCLFTLNLCVISDKPTFCISVWCDFLHAGWAALRKQCDNRTSTITYGSS